MRVFDMGRETGKKAHEDLVAESSVEPGDTWQYLTGYALVDGVLHGDHSAYLGGIEREVTRLPEVGLSEDEVVVAIEFLERTALELREQIGEE